jgi:hypothetical protein
LTIRVITSTFLRRVEDREVKEPKIWPFKAGLLVLGALIAMALAAPVYAGGDCEAPLRKNRQVTDAELNDVADYLQSATERVRDHLVVPQYELYVKAEDSHAYFDYVNWRLSAPYRYASQGHTKNPRVTFPIMLHELGHGIWVKNMLERSPGLKILYETKVKEVRLSDRGEELYRAITRDQALLKAPPEGMSKEDLQSLAASLEARIAEYNKLDEEFIAFRDKNKALLFFWDNWVVTAQEMFADLFAVTITGDKDALKKALVFAGDPAKRRETNGWRGLGHKEYPVGKTADTPYFVIHDAMYDVEKYHLSDPGFRNEPGKALSLVLDGTLRALEQAMHMNWPNMTREEWNQLFIEAVDAHFENSH